MTLTARANTGAGTDQLATDILGTATPSATGEHVGIVKLMLGGDGVNGGLVAAGNPVPVSGTFFQATQPVSAAALPLPTGAASETTLATLLTTTAFQARTPALGSAAAASSSPVTVSTEASSGNITTQNLAPNGAATAGSAVEVILNGASQVSVQVTGTYTGALSFQVTNDGARWETIIAASIVNFITGASAATIASGTIGIFIFGASGFARFRVTGLAAMTGSAAVTIRTSNAASIATVVQPTAANLNVTVGGTLPGLASSVNLVGDVGFQYRANATGAGTPASLMSPVTPAVQLIKATAGRVAGLYLQNSATAVRSVKFFNVAAPTLGTTAAIYEIDIPAGGAIDMALPGGVAHTTAIAVSVTSAKGLTDNTATGLAANDVSGVIVFA